MTPNKTLKIIGSSLVLFFAMTMGVQAKKPPPPPPPPGELTPQEELGEYLFKDTNLSEPAGQSCESCHDPALGFVDPVNVEYGTPVSAGAFPERFGNRNTPSAGYAAFIPNFTTKRGIKGG